MARAARPPATSCPRPSSTPRPRTTTASSRTSRGPRQILDDAGWTDTNGNGIRDKDGVELSFTYQTSTNAVRQDTQALVKQWWDELGVETELRNVDASVFFGGDPASPDTFQKFYADIEMYTNNFSGVDPEAYMANWACSRIPTPATQWQGENIPRYLRSGV